VKPFIDGGTEISFPSSFIHVQDDVARTNRAPKAGPSTARSLVLSLSHEDDIRELDAVREGLREDRGWY